MARWLCFVCAIVLPSATCVALELAFRLHLPGWAWFLVGGSVVRVCFAVLEIVAELRESLYMPTDEQFRPWFKPFWRLMRVAGLLRAAPPPSLEVPNVDDDSVPPIREMSEDDHGPPQQSTGMSDNP